MILFLDRVIYGVHIFFCLPFNIILGVIVSIIKPYII